MKFLVIWKPDEHNVAKPACPALNRRRGGRVAWAGQNETSAMIPAWQPETSRATMGTMIETDVLRPGDRAAWEALARGYKAFYHDPQPDGPACCMTRWRATAGSSGTAIRSDRRGP